MGMPIKYIKYQGKYIPTQSQPLALTNGYRKVIFTH